MQKSVSGGLPLFMALIAGGMLARAFPGPSPWINILAGLVLLLILFAYEGENQRSAGQSTGFAAVCGFCLLLAANGVLSLFAPQVQTTPYFAPLGWIAGAILFFIVDRSRQSVTPVPSYQPPRMLPAEETPAPRQGAVPMPPPGDAPPANAPLVNAAPPPNAIALPLGVGKPASIYLNLVGEGLACLRPVQAEHLGKDFYRIVESVPEGEAWEFQPGQIVRCQKKNLSSGKALVAVEEAPRAR